MERLLRRSVRVGVALGAHTLQMAWVVIRPGGHVEWRYRVQPHRQEQGAEELREAIAQLLRPLQRRRLHVHVSLAAPPSCIRWLTLQVPDARRLAHAVRAELPTLLPFDVERAQVRFHVHRQQRVNGALTCDVAVAACEAHALHQDVDALWHVGWATSAVVPSAVALVETAKALRVTSQEPMLLMDIGERLTTIVMVEQGEIVYARDVALGDDHMTDALMRQLTLDEHTLSLSREDAEALKRQVGIPQVAVSPPASPMSGAGPMPRVGQQAIPVATYVAMLQPVLEQLVSEVRRTTAFVVHTSTGTAPQRMVISGPGSQLPGCDTWLAGQLGIPVTRLDCSQFLGPEGSAAALVCGLALLDRAPALDLQPRGVRERGILVRAAARVWKGLMGAVLVVWMAGGWWSIKGLGATHQAAALNARWSALEPVASLHDRLTTSAQLVHQLVDEDGLPTAWLRRLAEHFPNPVRLTQLTVHGHRVGMVGQAQERDQSPEAQVSEFVLWLERDGICRGVQLGSTRRVATSESVVEFTLECQRP